MQSTKEILQYYYTKEQEKGSQILSQLQFMIYGLDSDTSDMFMISKIVTNKEERDKLFQYFADASLNFPSWDRKAYLDIISLVYFLRTERKMSWSGIRKTLKIDKDDEMFSTPTLNKECLRIEAGIHKYVQDGLARLNKESDIAEAIAGVIENGQ